MRDHVISLLGVFWLPGGAGEAEKGAAIIYPVPRITSFADIFCHWWRFVSPARVVKGRQICGFLCGKGLFCKGSSCHRMVFRNWHVL